MSHDSCRLCNASSTRLVASISDAIVANLLDFVPQLNVEVRNGKLPTAVCQLCVGKAKVAYDFMLKVLATQVELSRGKFAGRAGVSTAKSLGAAEALLKVQRVGSISIKKVASINESVADERGAHDSLIEEEELEMLDDDNFVDVADSDDDFRCENNDDDDDGNDDDDDDDDEEEEEYLEEDEDSDDSYSPRGRKRKSGEGSSRGTQRKREAGAASRSERTTLESTREIIIDAPISYSCARCHVKFSTFEELTAHMKSKQCQEEEISCKVCHKTFKSKKNLWGHMVTHRPKEKIICELCAKEYNHQFDLESHMESVHHRIVKRDCIYRCTHCEDKFNSHLDLLEHVKEHQREKKEAPRLCEVCAKVCANLKAYQSHIVIHKEKKAHTCVHCGKGFAKAFLMAQHMHIHTGIKAFTCDICNKSYAKRDSLRNHKKRDHPETI